ncbi:hypothetical protein [Oricola thermophila]|uniref:Uncharacterized protein n=1 Tax=Oricola thermophila TaxID=2742145 RepID=A0A6N1VDZ0_9HYPH|nr:hypothetical protein [Oricola thermophila]QKV18753.1 hypothetical protein HTY61_09970 [Oricola thermophila]
MTTAGEWERVCRAEHARWRRQRAARAVLAALAWTIASIGIAMLAAAATGERAAAPVQWIAETPGNTND